jgi:hypothetical protein
MSNKIWQFFWEQHEHYGNKNITFRRYTTEEYHAELRPFLNIFNGEKVGESFENRPIYRLKVGSGKTKVMLWSQMHGDEPTASMAILDMLAFFADAKKHVIGQKILENLSLHFIPLVNPDGVNRFQRRNALFIDINRDFLALSSPEARILKQCAEEFRPDYGFNLHDQNKTYGVGKTDKNTVLSFLAPAADEELSMPENRLKAFWVCNCLSESGGEIFPGSIAKYSDEFEPRAFGDNFQKSGIATILVESGYLHGDPEKQTLRKAHFALLLEVLYKIATEEVEMSGTTYENLPKNENNRFADLKIKNLSYKGATADLLLSIEDFYDSEAESRFSSRLILKDFGDLSGAQAFDTYDFAGKNASIEFENKLTLEKEVSFGIQLGGQTISSKDLTRLWAFLSEYAV